MDNVREKIKNIRLLVNERNIENNREEIIDEVDRLEAIMDYIETKNNSLRVKVENTLKEVGGDIDTDLEEISDILY